MRCEACGSCAAECPTNALELLGRRIGVNALVSELVKDRAFFESSGGGVTLSGGEPLAQAGFATAILKRLKAAGIETALDTCGLATRECFRQALRETDTLLFDIKFIDPQAHASFTGQSNELILANICQARAFQDAENSHLRIWVRTPLIPGATATEKNLAAIGGFLAENLDGALERWELCAFNNLCREQYTRLGRSWDYAATPLYARDELDSMAAWARSTGIDPARVAITGAAREST
jgi:pyruvate formate lyase activating enzyme